MVASKAVKMAALKVQMLVALAWMSVALTGQEMVEKSVGMVA